MLIETIVSVASFFSAGSAPAFFEQTVQLEPGQNIIQTDDNWNAVTMFTLDGRALPEVCYFENESEVTSNKLKSSESSGITVKKANGQRLTAHSCIGWHPAEEAVGHAEDVLDLLYFPETRKQLIVQTDTPVEVGVHFFNSTLGHRAARADLAENSLEYFDDNLSKSFRAAGQPVPRFFSRAEWGADGEGRTANAFERFFKPKRWKVFGEDQEALAVNLRPTLVKTHDNEGEQLYWPIYKNPEIRKFIIHHTGEAIERRDNTRTNFELVRAIEQYHSYTRNWGDIGYNYLIDKQGNIYEGRSNGPDTLGAHTWGHNSLSLGIALMGNFNYEEPTEAQLSVLALLLADHGLRFGVNPLEQAEFLGINSNNISGHRDVARTGHGTACPGENLHAKLPQIREQTAEFMRKIAKYRGGPTARDFLGRSSIAPQVQASKTFKLQEKPAPAEFGAYTGKVLLSRGSSDQIIIRVKNNTDETWPALSEIAVENLPDGIVASKFRNPRPIRPGQSGVFRGTIEVADADNGTYYLKFSPEFLQAKFFDSQLAKSQLQLPVTVSGGKDLLTASTQRLLQANSLQSSTIKTAWTPPSLQKKSGITRPTEPSVKIKIADFTGDYVSVTADELVEVYSDNTLITRTTAGNEIKIWGQDGFLDKKLRLEINDKAWSIDKLQLRSPGGIFRLNNYQSARFGQGKIKYNLFRDQLNIHNAGGKKLLIVNELALESYLWGLAEQPQDQPDEKEKAIHILARSYAYVYSQPTRRKFQTFLYDLENDPQTSQLYLGAEWEKYHKDQKNMLAQTRGQVVTKNGEAVIAPYFTQSSGQSSAAWSNQYPWAKVQPLPYDEGLEAKGHGVGLSGNSARVLAEQGKNYKQIIDYFFDGVEISKKY